MPISGRTGDSAGWGGRVVLTGRRATPAAVRLIAMRGALVAALLAALVAALLAALATPAGAQEGDDSRIRLTITELSGVLGPGSRPPAADDLPIRNEVTDDLRIGMLIENAGDTAVDALRVVVEVHPPVSTRGLLRSALLGDVATDPSHVHVSPELQDGDALAPGQLTAIDDVFVEREVEWAEGAGGVHPIKIAVMRGTEMLDEVVTAVVWLGEFPGEPMLGTVILPLDAAPWRSSGGTYPDASGREARPGGRLDALMVAAEANPSTAFVLAPAAHLLEDLADRADGFDASVRAEDGTLETRRVPAEDPEAALARSTIRRIRELAAGRTHAPVSGPYADADLAAILAAGPRLSELAGAAAAQGRRRLQLQLGTDVDAGVHLVDGPITPAVLDLIPGDTVLLPPSAVELPELDTDPTFNDPVRELRAPSGRRLTALVADPYLTEALTATGHPAGPLVVAQRVVAETAMAHLVAPGVADRALVLAPPPTWDPSPAAAAAVLQELERAPWIELSSPSRVATLARSSVRVLDLALHPDATFRPELVDSLARATSGLASLREALPDPGTRIQGRAFGALEEDLLRATSRWHRTGAMGESDALVRDVQRAIDTSFGDIDVSAGTVTLTSDTGKIPITLQRTQGNSLQVVVSVQSQGRLTWPDGQQTETLLLDEGATQTVSFTTRAISTGTFPVTVRVTDPSGEALLATTSLSVRSTAISEVALAGTAMLVVVLLLFGAQRRRDRSPRPLELVDHH